jgi:hypothetical protein
VAGDALSIQNQTKFRLKSGRICGACCLLFEVETSSNLTGQ